MLEEEALHTRMSENTSLHLLSFLMLQMHLRKVMG